MDSFFARRSGDGGLNLSQHIWKYEGQFRQEMEMSIDCCIGQGMSANSMAAKVKQFLNHRINCLDVFVMNGESSFYQRMRKLIIQGQVNIVVVAAMLNVWHGRSLILHIGQPIMKGGPNLILL